MTRDAFDIRRRPDGAIDTTYYARRAVTMRRAAMERTGAGLIGQLVCAFRLLATGGMSAIRLPGRAGDRLRIL